MVYKDKPLQEPVAIDDQPIPALLENLKHPVDGVRHRTRVELSERESGEVIAAAGEWARQFDPKKKEDAHPLLEVLWLHQQHNIRNEELLVALLESPEPHARIAAATVKHHWGPADPTKGKRPTDIAEEVVELKVDIPAHLSQEEGELYKLGAEVFVRDSHCATCHQDSGLGLDPVYPPLVDSEWVTGSEERLIKLTLHGLWGPIRVKGKLYDPKNGIPPMTAFGAVLKDEEVAGVLTYVRNSWGNKAPAVKPETVRKVRGETRDRTIFWKPEELLEAHPMEK
jgi:mono/diheme cytochrome c family protein